MGHQSYFVVTSIEGGLNIQMISKAELEKRLSQQYYGERIKLLDFLPPIDDGCFDPDSAEKAVVVIKGEVIMPQAVQKVTEYRVE